MSQSLELVVIPLTNLQNFNNKQYCLANFIPCFDKGTTKKYKVSVNLFDFRSALISTLSQYKLKKHDKFLKIEFKKNYKSLTRQIFR